MSMRLSLIVAMAKNRTIGLDGAMPWHIPEDLKFFKRVTMGHPVIMGRKTYQSIGAALPGRTNIVVTRNKDFEAADADVVHDLSEALTKAKATEELWRPDGGREEIFVIGGADIYGQALPEAQRIYMTEVHQEHPGDAFFPELAEGEWKETDRQDRDPETPGGSAYSLVILDRVGG
ncbi:MAG TPA: dihydrofolate reductase [Rhodospirillales bacterium]|nr:dihydrofolate reductase [Rhodospirillales bacterium]